PTRALWPFATRRYLVSHDGSAAQLTRGKTMFWSMARMTVSGIALSVGLAACAGSAHATGEQQTGASLEEQAVRQARREQNAAMASGNVERIAEFWTDDVEMRRGLGFLVVGREAYRKLFVDTGFDSAVVYQREPETVTISTAWPLAYESGSWAGHLGGVKGPAVIGGSYAAQWVKRGARWLIRGEVYVALTCAGRGCAYAAAP
ncbi:MAG: nuclear transport factor 2 family protein, partial [Gemmatimonadota bacterium]